MNSIFYQYSNGSKWTVVPNLKKFVNCFQQPGTVLCHGTAMDVRTRYKDLVGTDKCQNK